MPREIVVFIFIPLAIITYTALALMVGALWADFADWRIAKRRHADSLRIAQLRVLRDGIIVVSLTTIGILSITVLIFPGLQWLITTTLFISLLGEPLGGLIFGSYYWRVRLKR